MTNKNIVIDINDVLRDNLGKMIEVYTKYIDPTFDKVIGDIKTNDFYEYTNFKTNDEFLKFKYVDYVYELFGVAPTKDKLLSAKFNEWLIHIASEFYEDETPNFILVSPFESNNSLLATMNFITNNKIKIREIRFPLNSETIWDYADVLITSNSNLIEKCPEDKKVIKIKQAYNENVKCDIEYNSLLELINDNIEDFVNKIL